MKKKVAEYSIYVWLSNFLRKLLKQHIHFLPLPEHWRGLIEVNLCPWCSNGSIHEGIFEVGVDRLTLVVLWSHKISQFRRQLQIQGLSSNSRVASLSCSSINPWGRLDNWLELRDLENTDTLLIVNFFIWWFKGELFHEKQKKFPIYMVASFCASFERDYYASNLITTAAWTWRSGIQFSFLLRGSTLG